MTQINGVIIHMHNCEMVLNKLASLNDVLENVIVNSKLNEVSRIVHKYQPHGLTIVSILEESHILISTWPEFNYAFVEILLCSDENSIEDIANFIIDAFKPSRYDSQQINHKLNI